MKIQFRPARDRDLDFLYNLEKESFPIFQQNSRRRLKHGIKSNFQEVIVIELSQKSKKSIGSVVLFKYKSALRLYSIAMLKDYQNKGLGRIIINHIKDFARNNGFRIILLEVGSRNEKLIEWYKTNGFRVIDLVKDYYCPGEDALKMEYKVDEPLK